MEQGTKVVGGPVLLVVIYISIGWIGSIKLKEKALRSQCAKDSWVEPVTLFAGSPFALL